MGFPSFWGTSGLVGMKLVREYLDKKKTNMEAHVLWDWREVQDSIK